MNARSRIMNFFKAEEAQLGSTFPRRNRSGQHLTKYTEARNLQFRSRSDEVLVEEAEALGKRLTRRESRLTTSQIRALFGEVRQIEAQLSVGDGSGQQRALRKLLLLKPKMAYRAKREGRGVAELASVLDPAIDLVVGGVDPKENFGRFVDFFERYSPTTGPPAAAEPGSYRRPPFQERRDMRR